MSRRHMRPDRKKKRQIEAAQRQTEFDTLTPREKFLKTLSKKYKEKA